MGFLNFIKHGLIIEKVNQPKEPETDESDATIEDESNDLTEAEPTPATTPINQPLPGEPTSEEKRKVAECLLYGNPQTPPAEPTPNMENPLNEPANPTATPQQPNQQTYNAYTNVTSHFNNTLLGQTTANQNLLVIELKSPDDMSPILSNLTTGNPCIVSFSQTPDMQRHLDFLCGVMTIIGGTIMQRSATEYILTPHGVGIKSSH